MRPHKWRISIFLTLLIAACAALLAMGQIGQQIYTTIWSRAFLYSDSAAAARTDLEIMPSQWTQLIEYDGGWDNESWPLSVQAPFSGTFTITQVSAYAVGTDTPLLTFELEIRALGTINTAGTDVFLAAATASAAGVDVVVFDDDTMTTGQHLWWKTGAAAASGTVDAVVLTIVGEWAP